MTIPTFKLEEYLCKYEFTAPYLLCCSDAETTSMKDLLQNADEESLKLWENLQLSYTEVQGLPILREEISKSYPKTNASQIICFAGAQDAINCTMHAFLEKGDHAIVVTPCYQSLKTLPKYIGAEVTEIELLEAEGWQLQLDRLESVVRANTKMIIINYPHNPTGMTLNQALLDGLVSIARKHDLYVLSDEVYRLLGPSSTTWVDPVASVYEKGLSIGVMSKSYGLAGLRVGWIACQDKEMLKKLELTKHYTSICNSAPSEILTLMALRQQSGILKKNQRILEENLGLLDTFFGRHEEKFSWMRPSGGCTGFVRYYGDEGVSNFVQNTVERKGVLLLPGSVYGHYSNHFRIGFGRANMSTALNVLEGHLLD